MTTTSDAARLPWGGQAEPETSRRQALGQSWRGFRTATHLGWQTEANWTNPFVYFLYAISTPVFATLMLVFMIQVISGGNATPGYRAYVVIGSGLWSFVVAGIAGLAWAVLDDRERYRMLKYLFVSPNDLMILLLGRGLARMMVGAMGAVVTIGMGVIVLGLPLDLARVDWFVLIGSMILGLISIVGLGLILASVAMQTRQDAWHYPEAVAGALFLIVGAVFPLSVLPTPVQAIGLISPLTWWLEAVRRSLFPDIQSGLGGSGSLYSSIAGHDAPDGLEALLVLLVTTGVVTLAAVATYRWSERRAKDQGLFDMTTGS